MEVEQSPLRYGTCRACSGAVQSDQGRCPHCGADLVTRPMVPRLAAGEPPRSLIAGLAAWSRGLVSWTLRGLAAGAVGAVVAALAGWQWSRSFGGTASSDVARAEALLLAACWIGSAALAASQRVVAPAPPSLHAPGGRATTRGVPAPLRMRPWRPKGASEPRPALALAMAGLPALIVAMLVGSG